jgi:hypothetical protein
LTIHKRAIAVVEFVLLAPAVLFLTALFVRLLSPLQNEPAHTAQRIITWYAVRGWTLWVLLIGPPFAVLVIGCVTLLRIRSGGFELRHPNRGLPTSIRSNLAMIFIAVATAIAGVVLAVVAVHMLMN